MDFRPNRGQIDRRENSGINYGLNMEMQFRRRFPLFQIKDGLIVADPLIDLAGLTSRLNRGVTMHVLKDIQNLPPAGRWWCNF